MEPSSPPKLLLAIDLNAKISLTLLEVALFVAFAAVCLLVTMWTLNRYSHANQKADQARRLADDAVRALNLYRSVSQEEVFALIRKGEYPEVDAILLAREKQAAALADPPAPPPVAPPPVG